MIRLLLSLALAASAAARTDPCRGATVAARAKAGCVPALTPAAGLSSQERASPASDPPAPPAAREWKVFASDGRLALVFADKPGPLTSAAAPSGGEPRENPFLTGSALDPRSENSLRELLDASRGVREFIARLKKAGYRVEKSAPAPARIAPGSQWEVLKDGRAVLRVTNTPGPLFSTVLPPPGVEPPSHPFLSGSALDASQEGRLRKILAASGGTADFFDRLRGAGYAVVPKR